MNLNHIKTSNEFPNFKCYCHQHEQPLRFYLVYKYNQNDIKAACDIHGNIVWSSPDKGFPILSIINTIKKAYITGTTIRCYCDYNHLLNISDVDLDQIICSYWCNISKIETVPAINSIDYSVDSASHMFVTNVLKIGHITKDWRNY